MPCREPLMGDAMDLDLCTWRHEQPALLQLAEGREDVQLEECAHGHAGRGKLLLVHRIQSSLPRDRILLSPVTTSAGRCNITSTDGCARLPHVDNAQTFSTVVKLIGARVMYKRRCHIWEARVSPSQ